jgi:hypothetical protein
MNIWRLLKLDSKLCICHCYRKSKSCSDASANLSCESGTALMFFERCLVQTISLFLVDKVGVSKPCLVRR